MTDSPASILAFRLSPALQSRLDPIGEPVSIPENQVVFRQGEASNGVYLLRSGSARIVMLDDKQRTVTCRDLGAGCILGLPATLCVQPYMFTAETTAPCDFRFVAAERFQEFLRVNPDLCMEVLQVMSSELAAVNQRRTELSKCMHGDCCLRGSCSSSTN